MPVKVKRSFFYFKMAAIFCLFVFLTSTIGNVSCLTYRTVEFRASYDCKLFGDEFIHTGFTINITSNVNGYESYFMGSSGLPENVENFILSSIVISLENIRALSPYYSGVRHTSWLADRAVFNDSGILMVYGVDTCVLYLLDGNFTVDLEDYYIFMIMDEKVGFYSDFQDFVLVLVIIALISGLIFIFFIFYVLFFKRKREIMKQYNKIDKMGSKLKKKNKNEDKKAVKKVRSGNKNNTDDKKNIEKSKSVAKNDKT